MSITPITSDKRYTFVGNKGAQLEDIRTGVSLVIINRKGRIGRIQRFSELLKTGFSEIISVERVHSSYDVEDLSSRFPRLNFLLVDQQVNWGEAINMAIHEAQSDYVLVLWSDTRFISGGISRRTFEKIDQSGAVALIPEQLDADSTPLPVLMIPGYEKNRLRIVPIEMQNDNEKSLYLNDYIGIYSKKKFIDIGGYDPQIDNPYWQLMDFGFRSYMLGEDIISIAGISVQYTASVPSYDNSVDTSYSRFALKNLLLRRKMNKSYLPWYSFFSYFFRLHHGDTNEYKTISAWIKENSLRFVATANEVMQIWE